MEDCMSKSSLVKLNISFPYFLDKIGKIEHWKKTSDKNLKWFLQTSLDLVVYKMMTWLSSWSLYFCVNSLFVTESGFLTLTLACCAVLTALWREVSGICLWVASERDGRRPPAVCCPLPTPLLLLWSPQTTLRPAGRLSPNRQLSSPTHHLLSLLHTVCCIFSPFGVYAYQILNLC